MMNIITTSACIFRAEDGTLHYVGPDECLVTVVERINACKAAGLRPADLDIATVERIPVFDEDQMEPTHIILT